MPRLFASRDLLTTWLVLQLLVERARGCVEVHISHLPLNRKLTVSFGELCYGYPSGEITVDVTHHCGDVSAETAQVRRPISAGNVAPHFLNRRLPPVCSGRSAASRLGSTAGCTLYARSW